MTSSYKFWNVLTDYSHILDFNFTVDFAFERSKCISRQGREGLNESVINSNTNLDMAIKDSKEKYMYIQWEHVHKTWNQLE